MFVFALSLQQWSYIAEIVAGLGVLLVAFQVWLGVRNSKVELITGMTTLISQVDQAFIEHPGMRVYFHKKVEPPEKGTDDGELARAIAMTMANTLDHVVEHLNKMKLETRYAWRVYIFEVYRGSPVLEELLRENTKWWPGLQRQVLRDPPKRPWVLKLLRPTAADVLPAAASP